MHQVAYFLITAIRTFVNIMSVLIIIRVLLSWLAVSGRSRSGELSRIIYEVTEPVISLARFIPHRFGMIDFSAIIALIGLDLMSYLLEVMLSAFL